MNYDHFYPAEYDNEKKCDCCESIISATEETCPECGYNFEPCMLDHFIHLNETI